MSSIAHHILATLEPHRDALFARARAAAATDAAAEALLQSAVRRALTKELESPGVDVVALVAADLPSDAASGAAMPAGTWARIAATVQVEAARSAGSKGLNPDHVLLAPDPLLAPKKQTREVDPLEGLDLSPTSRFLVASIVAVLIGVLLTVYILTRKPSPEPATASTQTTAPARPR